MRITNVPPYEHSVQYYETDQMGIVHHSNYIRWMEEARCYMLGALGLPYSEMEKEGVMIPVLSVNCTYKAMSYFEDTILVKMVVEKYDGLRLNISYELTDKKTGQLRATGESSHCFLNKSDASIASLKRQYPRMHEIFAQNAEEA
ncbi:MAG: acyl-CoA thioesterase [Lachnospiraceae bacterium]|nr:acyl-CoA thioesterase [Lachnospiraceae bacterium]